MPVFKGYFTIRKILYNDIKHMAIEHVDRYHGTYRVNVWSLYLYTHTGKRYVFTYNNKRKARFDEICELIKARIPLEAQLPPPKQKWQPPFLKLK